MDRQEEEDRWNFQFGWRWKTTVIYGGDEDEGEVRWV